MDESFDLPVTYNGKEYQFAASFHQLGYIYRIIVNVNGTEISFERDEERNWRALVNMEDIDKRVETGLLQSIADTIEELLK
jgi:hypothetical protein